MAGNKKSLSEFWRVHRSRQEATELAFGLRALRKVAGHLGRNVKPVYWKGMVEEDEGKYILLDPDLFKGIYPIAHEIYDVLAGQVVFEGLSAMEFNEWVKANVLKNAPGLDEYREPYLDAIVDAAQTLYIHELKKLPVWNLYLAAYFSSILPQRLRDPTLPPSPGALADMWLTAELVGMLPEKRHPYYDDLLAVLLTCREPIRKAAFQTTMGKRREDRVALYLTLWNQVVEVLSQWPQFELDPEGINLRDEAGPKGRPDFQEDDDQHNDLTDPPREEKRFGQGLRPELANNVREILDEKSMIRQNIAAAVQEPGAKAMETRIQNGEVRSDIRPDITQVRKMKKVFRKQEVLVRRIMRKRYRRGLSEGKLDSLRLYRVPLDGKVFKKNQSPGLDHLWRICIVADASASMSGKEDTKVLEKRLRRPWEIAEKCFVSLAAAASGYRNVLDIYAYRAERNVCMLTRLFHGNTVYSVTPAGRTPSGQAIMTAASMTDNTFRKQMIVHITDGAANCGLGMGEALAYCGKQGIEVFTLGCGCNRQTRDFLREFFPPGHLYFLKSVDDLADGLEHLFAQKILGSIK